MATPSSSVSQATEPCLIVIDEEPNGPDLPVEYLEVPVKSANDKKDYRSIKLWNGLTALLISDPGANSVDSDVSDEANEVRNNGDGDETDIAEPPSKRRKIKERMAKCALSIGVGTFNDPPTVPGAACFLEQLVITGSNEDSQNFTEFTNNHGGWTDSRTSFESTAFKFAVPKTSLRNVLDRFANCLISPPTKRNVVAQAQRFECGRHVSHRSLTNDELYAQLLKLRERYYRAHNMTLTVEAKLPLGILEKHVKESLSCLSNDPLPSYHLKDFKGADLLNISGFQMKYDVYWTNATRMIEMTWSMPPLRPYRSKSHEYVTWIMGHRGKGSLISYLQKKNWCRDVSSGIGNGRLDRSLLTLTLILTARGYKAWQNIVGLVYSYISLLQREGPKESINDEIRRVEESKIRFSDETRTVDLFDFCENMRHSTSVNYITGNYLSSEYDPISIKSCIDMLTPENGNIIIYDRTNNDPAAKIEPWFKMKYTNFPIPKDLIDLWKNLDPIPELSLPEANVFLTDDFTVIGAGSDEPPLYPVKICTDPLSEVWYKQDTKPAMPKCCINIYYISPLPLASPENAAMLDLFVEIMKDLMFEELYPATLAGLNYRIRSGDKGLIVEVDGFNQKLPLLIEKITTYIAQCSNLMTNDAFDRMKKSQSRAYYNNFMESDNLTNDLELSLLRLVHWTAVDKHAALVGVKFDTFTHFAKHFSERLYVQCLVQGNMSEAVLMQCVQKCIDVLKCKPLLANTEPHLRMIAIPRGVRCCRVKAFDPSWLSVLTNFYQFEGDSVILTVTIEMLNIIANEPLFEEFRARKSVDFTRYTQFSIVSGTSGVIGYSLAGNARVYIEEIDEMLEAFRDSLRELLKDTSDEELLRAQEALMRKKIKLRYEVLDLKKEVERNWSEITSGTYDFERQERELEFISETSTELLRHWMVHLTMGKPNLRKLSVQVLGAHDIKENQMAANNGVMAHGSNHPLTYVGNLPHETEKPGDYYITNMEDYKRRDGVFVFTPSNSCA